MRGASISALAAASLLATMARGTDHKTSPRAIAVIVGPSSVVESVTRDTLREVYLRRQRLWPDGTQAVPVNLPPSHPAREDFSRLVLGRSTRDLVAYWNGRYFAGITPPQVLPSPAAIRRFLTVEPGAIAYLPLADVDSRCRTLLVLDPEMEGQGAARKTPEE